MQKANKTNAFLSKNISDFNIIPKQDFMEKRDVRGGKMHREEHLIHCGKEGS